MKCPHCLESFFEDWVTSNLEFDNEYKWYLEKTTCPTCHKFIIKLLRHPKGIPSKINEFLVYPKTSTRASLSSDVPEKYSKDYKEACLVIADSPKASAALSRRCLQHILREEAKVKHGDLSNEIQQVIDSTKLPSHLSESIDAIRNIGNFAAHPIKNTNTGEIVDVEEGEAEWLLDVLEALFDFFFIQPSLTKKKRAALDKKLQEVGKSPMK